MRDVAYFFNVGRGTVEDRIIATGVLAMGNYDDQDSDKERLYAEVIDDQIGDNRWVLGDRFSAADIYLFMLTTWLRAAKNHPSTDEFPNVKRIADAVMSRPSVQRVYAEWIAERG